MDRYLTDREVVALAGDHTLFIDYPTLMHNFNSIDELFSNGIRKVILLYLTKDSETGHWCVLVKRGNRVIFFDPYGIMPDNQLKWLTPERNRELDQGRNYLTKLLYDWSKKKGNIVEYNEYPVQTAAEDVATCGRHVAMFARFGDANLEEYQALMKKLKRAGIDLDAFSVAITDRLLSPD